MVRVLSAFNCAFGPSYTRQCNASSSNEEDGGFEQFLQNFDETDRHGNVQIKRENAEDQYGSAENQHENGANDAVRSAELEAFEEVVDAGGGGSSSQENIVLAESGGGTEAQSLESFSNVVMDDASGPRLPTPLPYNSEGEEEDSILYGYYSAPSPNQPFQEDGFAAEVG